MKKLLISLQSVLMAFVAQAQLVKDQILKVDTVPGHGYEVMFIGNKVTKKVYVKTDSGVKSVDKDFYNPGDHTWDQSKNKIDSIAALNSNWELPTTV